MISILDWRGEMQPLTSSFVQMYWHMHDGAIEWGIDIPRWSPTVVTMLDLMLAGF